MFQYELKFNIFFSCGLNYQICSLGSVVENNECERLNVTLYCSKYKKNRVLKMNMTAKTMQGLEPVLAQELAALGAENIQIQNRSVAFSGDKQLMYEANLWLRTALRILVPIKQFYANSENKLYQQIKTIRWENYLHVDDTFAIDSVVSSDYFNHSKYVALKVKDATADYFRDKYNKRPSVDIENPHLRINIYIKGDSCTLSLDSSGDSLHWRNYRVASTVAPLNEVLAAGLVLLSGWKGEKDFLDGMCGSGTIAIEAAFLATNTAPGLTRNVGYGFQRWNDFDQALWNQVVENAQKAKKQLNCKITASDIYQAAVKQAQKNIQKAGLEEIITLKTMDFAKTTSQNSVIIINPPYGERIQPESLEELYSEIGSTLKKQHTGSEVWILSGTPQTLKKVGLRPSRKMTLLNGNIECKFQKYELYEGTKRKIRGNI